MTISNLPRTRQPSHAGFGPVLNVGRLPAVALARRPLTVPLSARVGALVAGIGLALTVLAVPGGALALTVAQISPALAARNAPHAQTTQTTQTGPTTQTAVTDPRR